MPLSVDGICYFVPAQFMENAYANSFVMYILTIIPDTNAILISHKKDILMSWSASPEIAFFIGNL